MVSTQLLWGWWLGAGMRMQRRAEGRERLGWQPRTGRGVPTWVAVQGL